MDSRYGDGVRRISLMGQHVLYDIDDQAKKIQVLAVVGDYIWRNNLKLGSGKYRPLRTVDVSLYKKEA